MFVGLQRKTLLYSFLPDTTKNKIRVDFTKYNDLPPLWPNQINKKRICQ